MAQVAQAVRKIDLARVSLGSITRGSQPLLFAAYFVTAVTAFFYLPYIFPVKPSDSLSYAFGYNNHAAIVLLLLFACGGALWLRKSSLFAMPQGENIRISRATLVQAVAGTAILCALAWRLVVSPTPVADSAYIIDRIHLTAAGHRPYIDFEFAYGPVFLYAPLWIADLFHIQIAAAYYLLWVVMELVGVMVLYRVINEIDIPGRGKSHIFLLFCAASGATFLLGAMSYTFLRFAMAPYAAFAVLRLSRRAQGSLRHAIALLLSIPCWYAALLLISPETGLAFALGIAGYFLLIGKRKVMWWAGYLATVAAIVAVTLAADRLHLLDTMKTFAGGSRNFPIFPSGHILLFLPCIFLAMVYLARRVFSSPDSASVCLILVSVPMLAPALGSADPLHVFFNGLGFLAIGFLYLSQWKRTWDLARIGFVVFFVLLMFGGLCLERWNAYASKLGLSGDPVVTRQRAFPASQGVLEAPFGFRTTASEEYALPWLDKGRFFGRLNAPSVQDVEIKIREVASHPEREVLVPQKYKKIGLFDPDDSRLWLEAEYGAPYHHALKHPVSPYNALLTYLERHYHRVAPATPNSFQYELWAPNRAGGD